MFVTQSSSKSTILVILIELCYFCSDSYNKYNYTDSINYTMKYLCQNT